MTKGPAAVFIARHGARLDASDKTWHLTSPTPYDPPLTYGGWSQAKALGLRIAALLHQLDTDQAEAARHDADADLANLDFSKLDGAKPSKPKKKKRKIVIHSSPFLRCVQTSTAVAAGISQYKPPSTPFLRTPTPSTDRYGSSPLAKSPRSRSPSLHSTLPHVADPNLEVYSKLRKGEDKILLRVDAFLGEWLSPDYYQDITPPPNSTMMVAGAKADLLRRGDNLQQQPNAHSSRGHFPGGWSGGRSASVVTRQSTENGTLPTQGSLAQPLPTRERADTIGSTATEPPKPKGSFLSLAAPTRRAVKRDYNSPAPSYSVSPADPIPTGYVAHAREACVQVDFQWDSMRPPQEWGDGGEFGDEWSTMHKRFRKGLTGMMQWYREHGAMPPQDLFPGFTYRQQQQQPQKAPTHFATNPLKLLHENSIDDEEETVLILVTHGAGCNALLGAITNQPVLVNAGLASLSMAVRRELPRISSSSSLHERRPSVADPGMTSTYDMKVVASIDHLRPGCNPALPPQSQSQSQTQSPVVAGSPSQEYRRQLAGSPGSTSPDTSPLLSGTRRTKPSSLGSVRRTNSSSSSSARYIPRHLSESSAPAPAPATGLWSSPRLAASETPAAQTQTQSRPQQRTSTPDQHTDADEAVSLTNALERLTTNEERERSDSVAPLPVETSRSSSIATTPPAVVGAAMSWNSSGNSNSNNNSNSNSSAAGAGNGSTCVAKPAAGGLWGAKPAAAASQGLWGPPKLDGVLEHERGAKRRWTVTERN